MNTYTHNNYTFNAAVKTITLVNAPVGLVLQNIKYIKNLTRDVKIADPLVFTTKGFTYNSGTNVITLVFDTTTHLNTDILEIILECGAALAANNGTLTSGDGIITTGGIAQVLFSALSNRMGWSIMNTSGNDLYVNDLSTATTSSYRIAPGSEYNPPAVSTGAISILGTTTGQTFTARQWQLPNALNSTLFVQGATPAGQQTSSSSYPVVQSTDSYLPSPVLYTVTTAGTGYTIGDILQQTFNLTAAGTVTDRWLNVTQKTVITTPSTATIVSTMRLASSLNGSNFTDSVQKEWKVKTTTGTPTAAVGDIVLQSIKNNGGTVSTTWFNLTSSTLFTVAPTIANLSDVNTGQVLPSTMNGRQNFWMGLEIQTSAGTSNTLLTQITSVANVRTTGVSTYTVPAGKRLRITKWDIEVANNGSLAANTRDWSVYLLKANEAGGVIGAATPTLASAMPQISNNTATAQISASSVTNTNRTFTEGVIDLPPGSTLGTWVAQGGAYMIITSLNGYLYDI